jgi:hypothetical protein
LKNQPNFDRRKKFAAPFGFLTAPQSAAAHSLKTTEIKRRKYGWIGHTLRKSQNEISTAHLNGTRKEEDHVDAPKPPGGALFWRNAGKHHLANYELKPKTATDGS